MRLFFVVCRLWLLCCDVFVGLVCSLLILLCFVFLCFGGVRSRSRILLADIFCEILGVR